MWLTVGLGATAVWALARGKKKNSRQLALVALAMCLVDVAAGPLSFGWLAGMRILLRMGLLVGCLWALRKEKRAAVQKRQARGQTRGQHAAAAQGQCLPSATAVIATVPPLRPAAPCVSRDVPDAA
ncbi:MAG: hypothetical protein FWF49_04090 [Oscillospiraceae bacterium]|nr:hypothetical protein [Oscillospiraceae bacterium]